MVSNAVVKLKRNWSFNVKIQWLFERERERESFAERKGRYYRESVHQFMQGSKGSENES